MTVGEPIVWLTGALALSTFSVRSMVHLRLVTLADNISFIAHGGIAGLAPVLVLQLLLHPCNLIRLARLYPEIRSGDR